MKRIMLAFIILLSWSVSVVAGAEYNESNVMLYFNPTGGTRYHADMNCPSASEKYLALAGSFSWDQLYDVVAEGDNKLLVCVPDGDMSWRMGHGTVIQIEKTAVVWAPTALQLKYME